RIAATSQRAVAVGAFAGDAADPGDEATRARRRQRRSRLARALAARARTPRPGARRRAQPVLTGPAPGFYDAPMVAVIAVLPFVVAVAAGVYSTWSPCGLSMMSQLTPVAERGRGHRFSVTAVWFVLGALVGGATLGVGVAALAFAMHAIGLSTAMASAVAA